MANNVKKNTQGHNYKYADLAQINEYLESINCSYYQEVQTEWNPVSGEPIDYIWTTPIVNGEQKPARRGCRVEQATLRGVNNPAQEQGSALTYARRYSVLMAFGLATEDDDAAMLSTPKQQKKPQQIKRPEPQAVSSEQALELRNLLDRTGTDTASFLKYYRVKSVEAMDTEQYKSAKGILAKRLPAEEEIPMGFEEVPEVLM